MPLADRSNRDGDAITPVDTSKAFADPNPGDTLSYTASNLPKGLAIDPATGIISGTVAGDAAPGGYYVTVTATDDKAPRRPPPSPGPSRRAAAGQRHLAEPALHRWSVRHLVRDGRRLHQPQSAAADLLGHGTAARPEHRSQLWHDLGFVGHNASLNAPAKTGAGATLDGTYTVTVTADDAQGGTATQTFTVDSTNQAPTLGMPTADQHGADGQQVSIDAGKSFADPNTGDTLTYAASGLPAGLNIDPATGLITGTIDPRASASGPYTVVVTATDNKNAATQETFRFAVDEVPPPAGAPVAAASAPTGRRSRRSTRRRTSPAPTGSR